MLIEISQMCAALYYQDQFYQQCLIEKKFNSPSLIKIHIMVLSPIKSYCHVTTHCHLPCVFCYMGTLQNSLALLRWIDNPSEGKDVVQLAVGINHST